MKHIKSNYFFLHIKWSSGEPCTAETTESEAVGNAEQEQILECNIVNIFWVFHLKCRGTGVCKINPVRLQGIVQLEDCSDVICENLTVYFWQESQLPLLHTFHRAEESLLFLVKEVNSTLNQRDFKNYRDSYSYLRNNDFFFLDRESNPTFL